MSATSSPFAAEGTELLRLVTCGSVDDGKSTLLGRLLYDTKQVMADQLEHVEETSERRGDGYVNLALLTDGLRAEREQGITIDVAYRSFVTPSRRFQLADAPGHVQYTRNMVTGASTADVAVVLLDARKGVIEQTQRHTYIAAMLGIPHVVFAVNKMDLVDYDEARFREICRHNLLVNMLSDPANVTEEAVDIQAEGVRRARFDSRKVSGGGTLLGDLARLTCRIRLLWGERDDSTFRPASLLIGEIRAAGALDLHRIPAAGHWSAYENAAAVNRLMLEFFSS